MATKRMPPKKSGKSMPMDEREMARCMKGGKSHRECQRMMDSKRPMDGKKPMPMKRGM